MKRFIFLIFVIASILWMTTNVFSQEITVRFTGQLNGTGYCRLDRVAVINVTRNWTEMVEYPDTIIVLGSTVGANLNIAAVQGLGQNIPNPFDCETRVELSVSQREDVRIQLLDVAGKLYAEYNGSLDAGMHAFDISAANPQTYLLNATVGNRQYSIRMVNVGSGCGCSIKYAGVSGGIEAKLTSANEFLIGDNMRYVGYTTIDGESIASAMVEQMQVISQTVTLNFTHYFPPRVETLSATNITTTGATLNGNVTSDGGATVTARGFKYGTSADNLSQSVESGNGTGSYTANLTNLSDNTIYYYKAYATNSEGTGYGEVLSFTTEATSNTLNGHEWVDLGFSTKWATCNVGANAPEEYGNYYAWGETTTKTTYNSSTYTYSSNPTTLPLSADAATANWGSGWRMPTKDEFEELNANCTRTWTTQNGVNGFLFTSNINGNSIFLPAAGARSGSELNNAGSSGCYWSSSLNTVNTTIAYYLVFNSTYILVNYDYHDRYYGLTVRPVCVSTSTSTYVPSVTTSAATNITTTTATLNGIVTSNGGVTVTARGFMYGTSASNLSQSVQSGSGTGIYTKALSGLSAGTTYYYKAYATNSIGTAYGEVMSFTTENNASLPTVVTNDATNVTSAGATLSGNVTSDGGATVTARGFMYGTSANNLSQNLQSGSGTGSFSANITELSSGTTYYYKAYATNSIGTAYGEVMSFTTENNASLPTVVTNNATNVTSTGAKLNGNVTDDGGATVTERGFIYSSLFGGSEMIVSMASLESLWGCSTVQCGSGTGSFTANITDYDEGTTIYYKAYATNSEGTAYGEVMSCTTTRHEYVDLGLPSGLLWATCNVGANNPTDYGNYYAWGETSPKETYNSSTYTYSDHPTTLPASADAATVNWGASWRMPTSDDIIEVKINCTTTWTTQNGVNGYLVTGTNGNSIFIPAAGYYYNSELKRAGSDGYYWSSSHSPDLTDYAKTLYFASTGFGINGIGVPCGLTVRPVCVTSTTPPSVPSVTTSTATSITSSTATVSGIVTYNGGAIVTVRGFVYGTSADNLSQNVEHGSGIGSYTANLANLSDNTTYYYKAYATNSVGTAYGEVMSFTTENITSSSDPTGYINGQGYVDLGLPSGLRWATCNVGASTPTDYGNYYAWGETTTKTTYKWTTYTYCNGSSSTLTKYCNRSSYGNNGFTDNLTTLEAIDDAATANWGAGWRMPTKEEMNELKNNCTVTWAAQNGVTGRLFTGPNGNSIFLPAAGRRSDSSLLSAGSGGYYWSSSLYPSISDMALFLSFDSDNYDVGGLYRYYGYTVRPVCEP